MALDTRTAETTLENLLHDTILYALKQRLPSVASIAALRAVATTTPSGNIQRNDDDLICITGGSLASYRWNTVSVSVDDGENVVKPNDVSANGRWLKWTSPIRFSPSVGSDAVTLDQVASGPLARVMLLDKDFPEDEMMQLIDGITPAVLIECEGDDPEDATLDVGTRWLSTYGFKVHVVVENLRDQRQAAQGSDVSADPDPGANLIEGFIKVLLAGTALNAVFLPGDAPIQLVKLGKCENWTSDFKERRVIRSRGYQVRVTEEFPPVPSETAMVTDAFTQAKLIDQHQQPTYDPKNYLVNGCAPTVGSLLTQPLYAGQAVIAGTVVSYPGQIVTFAAYSDTYRDLRPDGTMMLQAVTAGGRPPPITAGALRLGVTTTNGSVVVGDAIIAQTQTPFGPNNDFQIPS